MPATGPSKVYRILVVEDDYFIAEEIRRHFEKAGLVVVGPVSMVSEAMRLSSSEPIDAAVLDINLDQGGSVFPLADALAARGIPFVFATGSTIERSHRAMRRCCDSKSPLIPSACFRPC